MRLTLAISPCPNDTFMFDALIGGRIGLRGLEFDVSFADIEQLNRGVMHGTTADTTQPPHISKISYAVLPLITDRYTVLDSGSALGHGNGPVLVARADFDITSPYNKIAVPGIHTTANLLLQRLFPQFTHRTPVLFSDIAPAVARGEFDAGVLIHEGRFTYRDHGLSLVADLGVEWERATSILTSTSTASCSCTETHIRARTAAPYVFPARSEMPPAQSPPPLATSSAATTHDPTTPLPLPLGAIVASRSLPPEIIRTVEELIRESIEYAFAHPDASREFIRSHARELDDRTIDSHIALFVNRNSLSLSPEAISAIRHLTGVSI